MECFNERLEIGKKLISEDIYIRNIRKVDDTFHARYSVLNKEYKYIISELLFI